MGATCHCRLLHLYSVCVYYSTTVVCVTRDFFSRQHGNSLKEISMTKDKYQKHNGNDYFRSHRSLRKATLLVVQYLVER
jgi:hypothetical protein